MGLACAFTVLWLPSYPAVHQAVPPAHALIQNHHLVLAEQDSQIDHLDFPGLHFLPEFVRVNGIRGLFAARIGFTYLCAFEEA